MLEGLISQDKLELLKIKLKKEKIKNPTYKDVMRLINMEYSQASLYLRAIREKKGGV